ncbi:MAG: bifunctional 5,10-methylene-tetrahydrofolate dehydrogenase/5,10-methylene-tetrahydrofolate cyclohydrolase [Firmicutes bacterium]|nr:bifunctional 5,10-methylene-tetrahydrofolate dehydrogenase/5,10-methylene-tetrahydrofolate cyclohydrolase [Bacillota bacterium]
MLQLLKGAPAAAGVNKKTEALVSALKEEGVAPSLAIVRAGEDEGTLSYENAAIKRCAKLGIECAVFAFCEKDSDDELQRSLRILASDPSVHGILLMRPLPKGFDEAAARELIPPEKDVDGCTEGSLAGLFTGSGRGFAPCTAQAVMEILDHYGIDPASKDAVVIGRSLVIGKPAAMLLLARNASVTICHSRSSDIAGKCKNADIIIAASGQPESVGTEHLRDGQCVIDVGVSWSEKKQRLCGDVCFEDAEGFDLSITPVPGGVGSVTTSILALHTAEAAARAAGLELG